MCVCISQTYYVPLFVDMTGIIPEDEEEEQEVYDDVGAIDEAVDAPIDEDIYEELPGPTTHFISVTIRIVLQNMKKLHTSV